MEYGTGMRRQIVCATWLLVRRQWAGERDGRCGGDVRFREIGEIPGVCDERSEKRGAVSGGSTACHLFVFRGHVGIYEY